MARFHLKALKWHNLSVKAQSPTWLAVSSNTFGQNYIFNIFLKRIRYFLFHLDFLWLSVFATCDLSICPAALTALVLYAAEKRTQSKCRVQVPNQGDQTGSPEQIHMNLTLSASNSPFFPLDSETQLDFHIWPLSGWLFYYCFITLLKGRHNGNERELHSVQNNRFLYPINWKCLMCPGGGMW